MDCAGRSPGGRAECGWNTHEETELAVVTAELDGGGEGGGGEEDGGDTDDGGLRGSTDERERVTRPGQRREDSAHRSRELIAPGSEGAKRERRGRAQKVILARSTRMFGATARASRDRRARRRAVSASSAIADRFFPLCSSPDSDSHLLEAVEGGDGGDGGLLGGDDGGLDGDGGAEEGGGHGGHFDELSGAVYTSYGSNE
jgi:hypothetical protein